MKTGGQNEFGSIQKILIKRPLQAMVSQPLIDNQWKSLNYSSVPRFDLACEEYERFFEILDTVVPDILFLPENDATGIDSIYARDALLCTDGGMILCNMGKPARQGEPKASSEFLRSQDIPILGEISGDGRLEGGDVIFLDTHTLVVGRGYRTNQAGINQLRNLVSEYVDEVIEVPLPHWEGDLDVFHLMSFISPLDKDLVAVYSRLLPVPFRELLIDRGFSLVEVPDDEFPSMGCNILTLAPRKVLMLDKNDQTRKNLEAQGVEVLTYKGDEISRKGEGGPTCLTRPLVRLED